MSINAKLSFLPIENEDQKIDVQLGGDGQITLKLSTWTDDLGWCSQKTLSFDNAMLDDLSRALTAARLKINRNHSENVPENETQSAKVITFPRAA